jgi:Sulfotransferase family
MKALVVNCFGRGGSALFLALLAGSPDVIPAGEWHRIVFRSRRFGKAVRILRSNYDSRLVDSYVTRLSKRKIEERLRRIGPDKPNAQWFAIKLMDRYSVFGDAVEKAHLNARFLGFVREPVGLCESLVRSGSSIGEAISWYNAVANRIAARRDSDNRYSVFRFEDLLKDPCSFGAQVYRDLGIRESQPSGIRLKQKRYGIERQKDEDAAISYVHVSLTELAHYLDRDVNGAARRRLSAEQVDRILGETTLARRSFGYE